MKKCKVVGTIKSSLYIREEKGVAKVGNGKLISYVFINRQAFKSKYYTEIYLVGKKTKEAESYNPAYNKLIKPLKAELVKLKPIRETIRYEEILTEATEKITDSEEKLNNKLTEEKNKLADAKKKLDTNYRLWSDKKSEVDKNIKLLLDNKSLLVKSLEAEETLKNTLQELKHQLSLVDENSPEGMALKEQIKKIEEQLEQIEIAKVQLGEIEKNLTNLYKGQEELLQKENDLKNGYYEYNKGLQELEKASNEGFIKINEEKKKLEDLPKPKWYLLDRTDNSGYINYKEEVLKVDSISKVLPIFFILVAMLMSINTLSRLIEEERTELGVLRANGFSNFQIALSYLLYIVLAGLSGLAIGLTIGYSLIPQIVYGVFLPRYYAPKLITILSPIPFTFVILVTIVLMIIVTLIVVNKDLKEEPALLLRPKAPKKGKKVFLERFKIWKYLSFIWKITIRNLFRYKKRVIMTIIGISGCTALLVTGLGLRDSINGVSKLQYEKIIKYDKTYLLSKNTEVISDKITNLFKQEGVVSPLLVYQDSYSYSYDNKKAETYLMVPSDNNAFNNYVNLETFKGNKKLVLDQDGILITYQMAKLLKAKQGDLIKVRNKDNELHILKVKGIVENYISNYIYMSKEYYEKVFNKKISYNAIIASGAISDKINIDKYDILMVTNNKDVLKNFDDFIDGLNKIIIMIVLCAAFLAIAVLYNLTIINVSERKKEIATLKVLGFSEYEVSVFVYRETFVLSIIGSILGLFLGIYLHSFVMMFAESDNINFLKEIKSLSFLIAVSITIIFSFIVQRIVNVALKKIDMIESLKQTE